VLGQSSQTQGLGSLRRAVQERVVFYFNLFSQRSDSRIDDRAWHEQLKMNMLSFMKKSSKIRLRSWPLARERPRYLDLAIMALESKNESLFCSEIIEWARQQGKLPVAGKTPTNSLYASMIRSVKADPLSPFAKLENGRFVLKRWLEQTLSPD
jgi:hypothetical protein